jgi:hypothetical protein
MHEIFQNKRFVGSFVILLFCGSLYLVGQFVNGIKEYSFVGITPSSPATINVSGTGEAFVKPDIAELSFSVTKEAKTVTEAQKASAEKINEITAYLKESGIDDKDIKTENYNLNPKYEWQNSARPCIAMVGAYCPPEGKQVLTGYEVSQTISVKIRKIDDAGKILVGVGDKGATNISGVSFSVDKKDAIEADARDKAIKDAQAKAKVLAKSLGVRITRVVSFSESGNTPVYSRFNMAEGAMLKSADIAPSIPTGENKFTSDVSIVYEIQ